MAVALTVLVCLVEDVVFAWYAPSWPSAAKPLALAMLFAVAVWLYWPK